MGLPMSRIRYIRNAARAFILHEDKLLTLKMQDGSRVFYILPGGGQLPGERLQDTVKRECLEEVNLRVKVGNVAYMREYIGKNHDFNPRHKGFHQVETVFFCNPENLNELQPGGETDNLQVGIVWIPIEDLDKYDLYPRILKGFFTEDGLDIPKIYLGDVN